MARFPRDYIVLLNMFSLKEADSLSSTIRIIFLMIIAVVMVSVIDVFFNGGLGFFDLIKD